VRLTLPTSRTSPSPTSPDAVEPAACRPERVPVAA
jgi:hypothetical protein